ncbi:ATP-grasp domain-containing protein, partial [Kingella kingae]
RFQQVLNELGLRQPPNRIARNEAEALTLAEEIGYPLVVRPSYVLGGRAMQVVHSAEQLQRYMREAVQVSEDSPVLLDFFLNNAIEVDVDCVSDGKEVVIGGIMQHVEQAGIHSGDSACSLPPYSLSVEIQDEIRRQTKAMAFALNVKGLMNVQFAVQDGVVFVLEVNPRASRTVPFVSKATSVPLAKIGARAMAGISLQEQNFTAEIIPDFYAVKEAVFPFIKFPGVDTILGPEMRSTGEVMGVAETFGEAYLKAQLGAGERFGKTGKVFIAVRDEDKPLILQTAKNFQALGYGLCATRGTAAYLAEHGIIAQPVNKVREGRPHIVDMIKNGEIALVINTSGSTGNEISDSQEIRRSALSQRVPQYTTVAGGEAISFGVKALSDTHVFSVQELHEQLKNH